MHFLRSVLAATAVAAFFPLTLARADTAEQQFQRLQHEVQAGRTLAGQPLVLEVDLAASDVRIEREAGRMHLRYRMAAHQVAEGWSWQPQADPAETDYYRYKFLPLQSLTVDEGDYLHEDMIGEAQRMRVVQRHDYFLAFDNLYDFYPRSVDDEAGFSAALPLLPAERLGLRAEALPDASPFRDSTTFWKAIHAQPRDLTLKKHYLIGRLHALELFDREDGRSLCRIEPGGGGRCRHP